MTYKRTYFLALFAMLLLISSCGGDKRMQQKMKWRVTLNKDDKKPYGTFIAYNSLKFYFPEASVEPMSNGFSYNDITDKMKYNNGTSLIIMEGLDFNVSDKEWESLKQFVSGGNEIVVFSSYIDTLVRGDLHLLKFGGYEEYPAMQDTDGLENKNSLHIITDSMLHTYGYQGRSIQGYFIPIEKEKNTDTGILNNSGNNEATSDTEASLFAPPDTLGYVKNRPDFIRYKIGSGHITLHAAPLVLSNYFLLQPGNKDYLTALWRSLPKNIDHIYWNEYYKRTAEESDLSILWRYPATRFALLLAIFGLIFYVLFEGKRRQRIIPIVAPLKNDSVSFVETVGKLYYNKGNHANLADKMVQQFLEWVRSNYHLSTNLLNEQFITQLIIKSGKPEATVRALMEMIHEVRISGAGVDDAYLYQLYNTIQQFYKDKH